MPLMLASPAFAPGGAIPSEYTCNGADISPPSPGPASRPAPGASSSSSRTRMRHRAPFAIGPSSTFRPARMGLPRAMGRTARSAAFAKPATISAASAMADPARHRAAAHHYRFRLLAISRPSLDLPASATASEVLQAAQPYVIQQTDVDRHLPALNRPTGSGRDSIGPARRCRFAGVRAKLRPITPRPGGPVSARSPRVAPSRRGCAAGGLGQVPESQRWRGIRTERTDARYRGRTFGDTHQARPEPGRRSARRRLWRYRHLAALHRQAMFRERGRQRAARLRRAVADRLGADAGRHRQIRPRPDARRQPRRGRHSGTDGAGPARRCRGGATAGSCGPGCSAPRCFSATG